METMVFRDKTYLLLFKFQPMGFLWCGRITKDRP